MISNVFVYYNNAVHHKHHHHHHHNLYNKSSMNANNNHSNNLKHDCTCNHNHNQPKYPIGNRLRGESLSHSTSMGFNDMRLLESSDEHHTKHIHNHNHNHNHSVVKENGIQINNELNLPLKSAFEKPNPNNSIKMNNTKPIDILSSSKTQGSINTNIQRNMNNNGHRVQKMSFSLTNTKNSPSDTIKSTLGMLIIM